MAQVHPIKVELARRGETQRTLAGAVGISPATLSQVLNGRAASWPALRRRVAEHFDTNESELFVSGQAVAS
jgi:transcriptional regulator with XRE-family HTH domain